MVIDLIICFVNSCILCNLINIWFVLRKAQYVNTGLFTNTKHKFVFCVLKFFQTQNTGRKIPKHFEVVIWIPNGAGSTDLVERSSKTPLLRGVDTYKDHIAQLPNWNFGWVVQKVGKPPKPENSDLFFEVTIWTRRVAGSTELCESSPKTLLLGSGDT